MKFINVTSVVYQLPFGKGRKFGSQWNPFVDGALGGWELNTINTANTGLPLNVQYTPGGGQRRDRPHPRLSRRGRSCGPTSIGNPAGLRSGDPLDHYFDEAAFSDSLGQRAFRQPGPQRFPRAGF